MQQENLCYLDTPHTPESGSVVDDHELFLSNLCQCTHGQKALNQSELLSFFYQFYTSYIKTKYLQQDLELHGL